MSIFVQFNLCIFVESATSDFGVAGDMSALPAPVLFRECGGIGGIFARFGDHVRMSEWYVPVKKEFYSHYFSVFFVNYVNTEVVFPFFCSFFDSDFLYEYFELVLPFCCFLLVFYFEYHLFWTVMLVILMWWLWYELLETLLRIASILGV